MKTGTTLTTAGRELSYVEAGRPDGLPVMILIGTPGGKGFHPAWLDDAAAQGLRLISYDRPGYGGSTPQPGRDVAAAAADVRALADALSIDRLLVWGISGGGPHALACAALLPDLVAAAASVAGVAPFAADGLDWFAGMGEGNLIEFGAVQAGRPALEAFMSQAVPGLLGAGPQDLLDEFATLLSPADAAVLTAETAGFLLNNMQEGLRERADGWIDDDLAFVAPWGFDLDNITVPVMVMHGAQDQFVPFSHGQWLAKHIPGATARLLPDDGHLSLAVERIAEVHAWLVSQI